MLLLALAGPAGADDRKATYRVEITNINKGQTFTPLMMQFACMYIPEHILMAHIAPNAALALLGALAGPLFLRRV